MKIDYYSFVFGVLFCIITLFLVFIAITRSRHSCRSCGCGTNKICRIFVEPLSAIDPLGMKKVSIYVFRKCKDPGCHFITFRITNTVMSRERLARKKSKEFEFGTPEIRNLLFHAGITNPHDSCISPSDHIRRLKIP